jgi:putative ABC transport system substrate-binding protein
MRRREFIAGIGAVICFSLPVRAQQGAVPVVGFLGIGPLGASKAPLLKGLAEKGYVENRNMKIDERWITG